MANKIITLNGNLLVNNGNAIQVDVGGGGSVNLQDKTNINPTTSSQTITADAGYDGLNSVQINAMPTGTSGTPIAIKGTPSNNQVSVTPSVTNTTGYITGGTITGTPVSVSASELVSGSTDITTNANNIDVANLASVNVLVKPTLTFGAIRPDAEIVKTWSWDAYAVDDWELTIPAYSTSAQEIKASASASGTYTLDYTEYDYFITERMLSIPTYSVTSHNKGRVEYWIGYYAYEVTVIPANSFIAYIDSSVKYTSRNTTVRVAGQAYTSLYWSSATAVSPYSTAAYSVAQAGVVPTISSGVLTMKTPTCTIRGSTNYFTSTYFNALTDIRYQWIAELWRAPKNNLNLDGWGVEQTVNHIMDCVNSTTKKLT